MSRILVVGCNDKTRAIVDRSVADEIDVHWFIMPHVMESMANQYANAIRNGYVYLYNFTQESEFEYLLKEPKNELHIVLTMMELSCCTTLRVLTPIQFEFDHTTGYAQLKFTDIGGDPKKKKHTSTLHVRRED